MGATGKPMHRGVAVALVALFSSTCAMADTPDARRLYDRQTDCAVMETAGFPADRANWDGPCVHGAASRRGTATFFGRDGKSETLSAEFDDGMVVDGKAEIAWSDGAHYSGLTVDGKPDGAGVLVDAKGNRFDGNWKNGALDGHGSVAWTNGDRYEGDWVAGKAEGHGVQVWADGQSYDGQWRGDQPNGQGTLTHKDGTRVSGIFVDGRRQAVAESSAPPQVAVPDAPAPNSSLLSGFADRMLIAVDGSTVAFEARDGAVLRTITAPDGHVQKTAFTFLGQGLGTVSDVGDPPKVSGVFRATPQGIVAEFSDGHVETLSPLADGLAITLKTAAGDQDCVAWYPQGHAFSTQERKEAVAAYAHRLGVADAMPTHPSCDAQAPVSTSHSAAPAPAAPRHKPGRTTSLAPPAGLQPVPVKVSTVHAIDGGGDAIDTAAANRANADEPVASNCLTVGSDGSYWGFRNHCGYAVQFAYCVLHGVDRMTACGADGAVSVPGSVSANGFGALFADDSLGERDVDHNFRWVGCKGGAGEVAAHLDAVEPASGHCVRDARTLAQGN